MTMPAADPAVVGWSVLPTDEACAEMSPADRPAALEQQHPEATLGEAACHDGSPEATAHHNRVEV
jgi:hypothetical protein